MEMESKTHGKIPSCVSHLFTFCAPCSDNQMCLEIQNTKLAKVRSKQLTMSLSMCGRNYMLRAKYMLYLIFIVLPRQI